MMLASEFIGVLKIVGSDSFDGDVYFKDEDGNLSVVDFIYDFEGNIVLCKYEDRNVEIKRGNLNG